MRVLFVLAMTLAVTLNANATIRRVAKDGSGDFITIQAAHDASPARDTIIVMGDLGPYSGFTVNRHVVIIGQGNGCDNVPATEVDGRITFSATADSSTVTGFYVYNNSVNQVAAWLQGGASSITIRRCRMYTYGSSAQYAVLCDGNNSVLVEGSVLDGDIGVMNVQSSCFITVRNSILAINAYGIRGEDLSTSISVQNSVFVGAGAPLDDQANWAIDHCIFWDCNQINGASLGYFVARFNAFNVTPMNFPYDAEMDTTILQDPFVAYDESIDYQQCNSQLQLLVSSGLINRGDPNAAPDRDGSRRDLGIYGGPTPFVDTGAPDFPFVTQLFVPATVPQNGVLEIRSTGRVGPGGGQ